MTDTNTEDQIEVDQITFVWEDGRWYGVNGDIYSLTAEQCRALAPGLIDG